jgi:hypothetical protein
VQTTSVLAHTGPVVAGGALFLGLLLIATGIALLRSVRIRRQPARR